MADTVGIVLGAITRGLSWLRARYREFKVDVASAIVRLANRGVIGAIGIAALVGISAAVKFVFDAMMTTAVASAVVGFLRSIGDTIKGLMALLQVDLLITLLQLGALVNKDLNNKLSALYDELGAFAQELELDFNYISAFCEVDRAILAATYQIVPAGFIKTSGEYVKGLSDWLKGLSGRMREYAGNPQLIFTEIQASITAERMKDANEEVARIWAAIDFAGDWVKVKGELLISSVGDLDAAVKKLPQDVQAAIAPWYEDAIGRVRRFEQETWGPFWDRYEVFTEAVDDAFMAHGVSIANLQRRIEDPLDWLRTLLALPLEEQSSLADTIDDFLASLVPEPREAIGVSAQAIADNLLAMEARRERFALAEIEKMRPVAIPELPEVEAVEVTRPWYKEG